MGRLGHGEMTMKLAWIESCVARKFPRLRHGLKNIWEKLSPVLRAPPPSARLMALGRPRSPARAALGPPCEELAGRAGANASSRKRGPGKSQILRDPAKSRGGAP